MPLRKAAAEFFEYLEKNNLKVVSELPEELLEKWSKAKFEDRLKAYTGIGEGEPEDDNVVELRKKQKTKQASP